MVGKCGCLPLAISLLGGVLSKKTCMEEWELVNKNINASLYRVEGKDNHIVKEDESIYSVDLYRMWIALGMISEKSIRGNETLTDIAEVYLTELASRCIVQVEAEDVIPLQKHRSCKLHDVVRELCLSMGEKEGFGVQILEYDGGKFGKILHESLSGTKTRHLAIHVKTEIELDEHTVSFGKDSSSKNLRSLEILSEIKQRRIEFPPQTIVDFRKFKLLRGLVIERFKFEERKLPRGITDLVQLRYLRLRECELDSLPSTISNLAYLDTLDIFGLQDVRVPNNVLKKMSRLKHLRLPSYNMETIGNYRLKLDDCVEELESLIGYDSSVHELKSPTKTKNLRRFSGIIRDNESLSTIINAIATEWSKLSYCTVFIKQGCKLIATERGLRNLKQAFSCPNLNNLRIGVELGKLLEECIGDIIRSKLVKLTLIESEIEDDPMGMLGMLPCLRELFLNSRSFTGEEMVCRPSSFPRLKKVVLDGLPNLREWRLEQGAMPLASEICLQRFQMD